MYDFIAGPYCYSEKSNLLGLVARREEFWSDKKSTSIANAPFGFDMLLQECFFSKCGQIEKVVTDSYIRKEQNVWGCLDLMQFSCINYVIVELTNKGMNLVDGSRV